MLLEGFLLEQLILFYFVAMVWHSGMEQNLFWKITTQSERFIFLLSYSFR